MSKHIIPKGLIRPILPRQLPNLKILRRRSPWLGRQCFDTRRSKDKLTTNLSTISPCCSSTACRNDALRALIMIRPCPHSSKPTRPSDWAWRRSTRTCGQLSCNKSPCYDCRRTSVAWPMTMDEASLITSQPIALDRRTCVPAVQMIVAAMRVHMIQVASLSFHRPATNLTCSLPWHLGALVVSTPTLPPSMRACWP